jgi:hypothetical protein
MQITDEDRVQEAAIVLDGEVPNWFTRINIDIFGMRAEEHCILAQLYGSYMLGVEKLKLNYEERVPFGANLSVGGKDYLKPFWINEINKRKVSMAYTFKKGDRVKVVATKRGSNWNSQGEMDWTIGQVGTVFSSGVVGSGGHTFTTVEFINPANTLREQWNYYYYDLKPAEPDAVEEKKRQINKLKEQLKLEEEELKKLQNPEVSIKLHKKDWEMIIRSVNYHNAVGAQSVINKIKDALGEVK